jgi:hypothetical protein
MKEAMLLSPQELASQVLKTPGIEGVTIIGGRLMVAKDEFCEYYGM